MCTHPGIIGIPYAMREIGLVTGWFLILLSGILGCKSLLLLVEMAKHVDATSYEILSETVSTLKSLLIFDLSTLDPTSFLFSTIEGIWSSWMGSLQLHDVFHVLGTK